MKPTQAQRTQQRLKRRASRMSEDKKEEGASTQSSAWEKFRGFIKSNKNKIIGVFAAIIAYLAGDGSISSFVQAVWTAIFGV